MRIGIRQLALLALSGAIAFTSISVLAQDATPEPGPSGTVDLLPGLGDDVQPAPASVGTDIALTYFGPPPSEVQRELIGPYLLVKAGKVDLDAGTVTLPLYEGHMKSGESVWYVLTDTNDHDNADALGLNFSGKLSYSDVGNAVRPATVQSDGSLMFERGTVDFSPERLVTPGQAPNYFPPVAFQPGSVGDAFYSPLIRLTNGGGYIYNAPIIAYNVSAEQLNAFCDSVPDHSITHDKVVRICPDKQTVTLKMVSGFSFARPVFYLSFDSNDKLASTIEDATYAPVLSDIGVGRDDSFSSAIERLFVAINGQTGVGNPQRQGLNSVLSGDAGTPLNVFGGIPTVATDYSPLWDMNLYQWTQAAIDKGYRARVFEEFNILGLAQQGWITGPNGAPFGSTGIIINCPVIYRFL